MPAELKRRENRARRSAMEIPGNPARWSRPSTVTAHAAPNASASRRGIFHAGPPAGRFEELMGFYGLERFLEPKS